MPIGTEWRHVQAGAPVRFPYNGHQVATAPVGTATEAAAALDAGATAVRPFGKLSSGARRAICLDVRAELAAHQDDFIDVLIAETGKPRKDCATEVTRALFTWDAAAEEVARLHGETVPLDSQPAGEGLFGFWTRRPIGLVVGIAGFNYPLLLASHKVAPAIAAGCPVICKPAPATPLATLWLTDIARRAAQRHGAPVSAIQVVTGDAAVGNQLVSDQRVGAVSFTGSASVGHRIARDAAPRKTLLELGSNAALVVASDGDLDRAADAVLRGGFYGNGQACISVQRVLVCASIRDEFLAKLTERIGDLVVGDPRAPETDVAALIDAAATERVLDWIDAAQRSGGTLLHGGAVRDGAVEPTVLVDVPETALAWCEEVFGPVVCVRTVADVDAALASVNRSRYGLHASIFTRSLATAFRAIDELDVGGVVVNEVPGFRSDIMPYGGVKDSGIGREGPRFAIEELTVTRMAVLRTE
nr:aldehyde dehydrogenase family protein [Tamaricihabitans halophyticus]